MNIDFAQFRRGNAIQSDRAILSFKTHSETATDTPAQYMPAELPQKPLRLLLAPEARLEMFPQRPPGVYPTMLASHDHTHVL